MAISNNFKIIYQYGDITSENVGKVGEKALNISEIYRMSLPTPPGFFISSDAYRYFLDFSKIGEIIKSKLGGIDFLDDEDIQKSSAYIEDLIMRAEIPPVLEKEILRAYSKFSGFSDLIVCVRSSFVYDKNVEINENAQTTFLNIKGASELILAIKACWASLFEVESLKFRNKNKISQLTASTSIIVQKMIQNTSSGILFTISPTTKDNNKISIQAVSGLWDMTNAKDISPDLYHIDKNSLKIVLKEIAKQEFALVRNPKSKSISDSIIKTRIPVKFQESQKIDDKNLILLAKYGKILSEMYKYPQEVRWGIEKGKIWIFKSSPIPGEIEENTNPIQEELDTVSVKEEIQEVNQEEEVVQKQEQDNAKSIGEHTLILTGSSGGKGSVIGNVKIIPELSDTMTIETGDILVTRDIDSDKWLDILSKASALILDFGTDEKSIAKEAISKLGIPAILGTQIGTKILHDGQSVNVDGSVGKVYLEASEVKKEIEDTKNNIHEDQVPQAVATEHVEIVNEPPVVVPIIEEKETKEEVHEVIKEKELKEEPKIENKQQEKKTEEVISEITSMPKVAIKTATKVYARIFDLDLIEDISKLNIDGMYISGNQIIKKLKIHPKQALNSQKQKEYVMELAKIVANICSLVPSSQNIIYEISNFSSQELFDLDGGLQFETKEENPIIGYRGAIKHIKEQETFDMELEVIKLVRNKYGHKNLWVSVPYLRTPQELIEIKKIILNHDLRRSSTFKIFANIDLPANVIMLEKFLEVGVDGVNINIEHLSNIMMGIDIKNPKISNLPYQNNALEETIVNDTLKQSNKQKVVNMVTYSNLLDTPKFLEYLIKKGVNILTIDPAKAQETKIKIAEIEKSIIITRK